MPGIAGLIEVRQRSFRIPFSVFIVSDMLQIASSHASYRFSISDEDSGERRLLVSHRALKLD